MATFCIFGEMNEGVVYKETQSFRQWYIWIILIGINGLWVFGIYRQVIQGIPFGNNPVSNNGLLLIAFLTVAFSLFFGNIKLTTIVKEDGIYVQFFPLQLSLKKYAFSELAHIYIRKYSGLKEYGGWGYRFGINGGMAYTASGSDGLQLVTIDGKKLLIGTQNPDELKEVLLRLNQYRPVGD